MACPQFKLIVFYTFVDRNTYRGQPVDTPWKGPVKAWNNPVRAWNNPVRAWTLARTCLNIFGLRAQDAHEWSVSMEIRDS